MLDPFPWSGVGLQNQSIQCTSEVHWGQGRRVPHDWTGFVRICFS